MEASIWYVLGLPGSIFWLGDCKITSSFEYARTAYIVFVSNTPWLICGGNSKSGRDLDAAPAIEGVHQQ